MRREQSIISHLISAKYNYKQKGKPKRSSRSILILDESYIHTARVLHTGKLNLKATGEVCDRRLASISATDPSPARFSSTYYA